MVERDDWSGDPDHDAHVRSRERVMLMVAVLSCERYVAAAKEICETRFSELLTARRRVQESLSLLNDTIDTFDRACRLRAISLDSE